jgi:uncharacterized protein YjiS (DUF1127 family)
MVEIIKEWFKKIQNAKERRVSFQALQRYSDRELQDIGIERGDIYNRVFCKYE